MEKPLTGKSSIGAWLKHPVGGPLVRSYLERAGLDERAIAPFKLFSLDAAARMSGGRLTPQMVERFVDEANGTRA